MTTMDGRPDKNAPSPPVSAPEHLMVNVNGVYGPEQLGFFAFGTIIWVTSGDLLVQYAHPDRGIVSDWFKREDRVRGGDDPSAQLSTRLV